jgi:hypothetical protein
MRLFPLLRYLLWAALLSAGAATAAATPSSGVGYVDLRRLVRENPLYGQLVHYDRAIAALREAASLWSARERSAALARDDRALLADFREASDQLDAVAARSGLLETREREALAKLGAMPRGSSAASDAAAFAAAERRTSAAVENAQTSNFTRYRDALMVQERRALAQTNLALNRRVDDAYAARVNEQREEQSTLALRLVRRDAYRVLVLRMRTGDVFHDQSDRTAARRELAAIDRRQAAALAEMRAEDRRELRDYRAQIVAQAVAERGRVDAQIRNRASADLEARVAILRAQRSQRALALPSLPTRSQPAGSAIAALRASSKSAISGQLASTRKAFAFYRPQLRARTIALERLDAQADAAYRAEISKLLGDRAALLRDLESWVMHDASVTARRRGIATISTTASARATDLTDAVAALMLRDESGPTP